MGIALLVMGIALLVAVATTECNAHHECMENMYGPTVDTAT